MTLYEMAHTRYRLQPELKKLNKENSEGLSAGPIDDDVFHWIDKISGPHETPYAGGVIDLPIRFQLDFPFKPRKILCAV